MASIINATTTSGLSTSADNSGSLQLATNNGTTAVTIDTSQNVGIGTASPGGYKLAVGDGSGNRGRIMLKGATGGNYPEINIDDTMNTSGKNYQIFSTGGHLKFQNQTDGALVSFVANAFGIGLADNAPVDGDGIRFPATQSASSNANTLDDYEEGTWTTSVPAALNITGTPSLTEGRYTKIGRLVTIEGYFSAQVTSSNANTYWTFTLPFVTASNNSGACGAAKQEANFIVGAVSDATSSSNNVAYLSYSASAQLPSSTATHAFSYTYIAA